MFRRPYRGVLWEEWGEMQSQLNGSHSRPSQKCVRPYPVPLPQERGKLRRRCVVFLSLAQCAALCDGASNTQFNMKIGIGSDHAGVRLKERLRAYLISLGHDVHDFGAFSEDPVDYPLFIRPTAEAVTKGECERGIVLGGSGNGEAMVANRVKGVRCALCWNVESARLGRQHNNANVISLGERMVSPELALEIVKVWLDTPFEGGRHQRRIDLIDA